MSEHELWNELGNLHYLSGSYEQAIHAYTKSIQHNTTYGKPYSNLALIYAKQAKYEIAIDLYKRSLELLKNDIEKAATWKRLGNVYCHLKEYEEAVNAFHCADDLRAAASRYDGRTDQMVYVTSELETPHLELVETQREYQNHSVDYMRDVEPEFDETIPDWVPVEAEMLVNEVDHAQKINAAWRVGSSFGFTPPPIAADEKQSTFVESEYEHTPPVPDNFGIDEEAQPAVAAAAPDDVVEPVTTEESPVDELIQPLGEDEVVEVALLVENHEIVSDDLPDSTVDAIISPEDEAVDTDLVASESISQTYDVADAPSEEMETTEAFVTPIDEALENDPVSQEPITQVEDVVDAPFPDTEVETLEVDLGSVDVALENEPEIESIDQIEDIVETSDEMEAPELETDHSSGEDVPENDFSLFEPIAQAEDIADETSDKTEAPELETSHLSGEDVPENDFSPFEPIAQAKDESIQDDQDFDPDSNTLLVEEVCAENEDALDALIVKREIDKEEEHLTKQIEINPRSATTWEALGTLYKTAGRYEEAVQAFKQAITIAPKTVSYYHNLGLVYAAQGNNEEAFKTFQEVLELDPNHSLTHASLGGYYKKIGLDELAKKHIGKAMKHIYESENEYNRACMDAICGNVDNAIKLLRVALENRQTYVDWVLNDPDLDSLRGDDRFRSLISDFSI